MTDLIHTETLSTDQSTKINVNIPLGYDGNGYSKNTSKCLATIMVESGDILYFAYAAPGTATSTAKWRAKKMDFTTGMVVTWADGNQEFDNVATSLASLSYS